MTPAEEKECVAFAEELADAEHAPFEPRCICAAFARSKRLVLTMQGWIDLEAVQSPLLQGQIPDGEDASEQLAAAVDAFNLPKMALTPEAGCDLVNLMLIAIEDAFSMRATLQEPGAKASAPKPRSIGEWLAIMACLVGQLTMSRKDALETPVAQAFGLIVGHRVNQGWTFAGASYVQRDIGGDLEDEQPTETE